MQYQRHLPSILDIEASGLGRSSYPIEVGYVLPDGKAYCSLIAPQANWTHWDEQAEALHGISRDHLVRCGKPAKEVAEQLNAALQGQTVYTDGWSNDYSWLHALFEAAGLEPQFKLDNLRTLLSEAQAAVWHATKDRILQKTAIKRHRASADAKLLQLTLQHLQRQNTTRRRKNNGNDFAYGVGV